MKRFFLVLFLGFLSNLSAQIHEIGVFVGGSNYIGDIGPTTYINPNEMAYGVLYKWNRSPRHSWRASYTQTKLSSNDINSNMGSRNKREFSFENNLKELSAGIEFNFLNFDQHEMSNKISPYVYTGLSYARYEGLNFKGKIYPERNDTYGTVAIPITIGVKAKIAYNLVVAVESGARYSLSDAIDGSNPNKNPSGTIKFGNLKSNDWYVFSGATLTYTFGNKPCYCKE
jgi:Domain of unknown function (DUF6089)